MDIDFSLILVVLVLVTGAVSLLDLLFFAPRRKQAVLNYQTEAGAKVDAAVVQTLERESAWVEYPKSFFPVLLIVLLLRSFLVEPFTIPSGSMLPTLEVGDFILVNKYHYGLRLPVLGTKILALNEPDRGDIMVFKYPENPRINYIKRVIGLPGDKIRYQNNVLTINGEEIDRKLVARLNNPPRKVYVEKLTREHPEADQAKMFEHELWAKNTGIFSGEWVVPEGHYFMLGDNRDNSRDSRVWGFVPDKLIVGKAFAIWMNKQPGLSIPSFNRNGFIE